MAESAVQLVIEKLNDFLSQEVFFSVGVDERVRSLQTKLEWIRAFLKDVDGIRKENERVKLWVAPIREAAYDAEDVIDTFIYQNEQRRGETSAGWTSYFPNFAHDIKDLSTIRAVGKKISHIERRLDEIYDSRSKYGVGNISEGEASSSSNQSQMQREKRAPVVEEADVVGIENETRTIVGRLIEGEERRAVISITGMGGIGKTTLAKKVYNNIHAKKNFDFHAWVYVSQEYRVLEVLQSIINCFRKLSRDEMETTPEEELRMILSNYLEGKRYLVVIDDIWDREAWDGLFTAFPDGKNGSRVLLTTRNEDVARYADIQSPPHRIRFLNEMESWVLFCKKAFAGNPSPVCPPNLNELGRKMVAKCGGLPLAIAVLGGILSRKDKSVNEWEKVLQSVEWWLNESKDRISGILALSYHDLPYFLKPCFLYFGAFPEDSEISVANLIRMWIAEGFVHRRGGEEMEDVAEDYIEELISRSMIQVAKRKSNGIAEKCRIHDILRDLAILKAKDERFLDMYGSIAPSSLTTARRLAITNADISKSISLNSSTLHLRSLLHFRKELQLNIPLGAFKVLRVMDVQNLPFSSLPDEIGYLIHLRYLRLKGYELKSIPSTITRLSNLQTLDLWRTNINMLPDDIWKMEQIRHLLLSKRHAVKLGPIGICSQLHRLCNLQTLKLVKASSWIQDALERLISLRELGIEGDLEMPLSHSLHKLVRLRSLWLQASPGCSIPAFKSFANHQHLYKIVLVGPLKKLPEVHEFPPNLTQLYLYESQLKQDPMETLEKLPNLQILKLQSYSSPANDELQQCFPMNDELQQCDYAGKEMVCSGGGFPQLRVLSLREVETEEWRVEEGAMPNLRCLEINDCHGLEMLPAGLQHLTTLQELHLAGMWEDFIERVREDGEDWFKIQHIPSVIIKNSFFNVYGQSPPRGPVD